jgi:hypothetical protein
MVLGCDRWARGRLYAQCVHNRAGVRAVEELRGPKRGLLDSRGGSPAFLLARAFAADRERVAPSVREEPRFDGVRMAAPSRVEQSVDVAARCCSPSEASVGVSQN